MMRARGETDLFVLFFIAGLFLPALPWGPLAALIVGVIRQWRGRAGDAFLDRWWEVSRPRALAIVAWRIGIAVAVDTCALLLANWMRA